MILDKEVKIIVNNQQLVYYKTLGYDAEYRKALMIKPVDLSIGSHYKINVCCDICSVKTIVEFRQLKGSENYLCKSCAAKNKKKKIYTEEEKNIMVKKTKHTREQKLKENPNYLLNMINKMLNTKKKYIKREVW